MKKKEKKEITSESTIGHQVNYLKTVRHNYCFKPAPVFVQELTELADTTFFGVEIEKESQYVEDFNSDLIPWRIAEKLDRPSIWYSKYDGSLECGIEVVSHPVSLLGWVLLKNDLSKLFKLFIDEDFESGSTTGLHIHYSRKNHSFNKANLISRILKEWWEKNASGVKSVLQRSIMHYCDFTKTLDSDTRYKAFNYTDDTFEIRVWDSPSSSKRFYYCLFCTAAIELLTRNDSKFLESLMKEKTVVKDYQAVLKFIFITYPEIISKSLDVEILRPNYIAKRIAW